MGEGVCFVEISIERFAHVFLCCNRYGDIGKACARLAKAYGMKVVALRRNPKDSQGDRNVDQVRVDTSVAQLILCAVVDANELICIKYILMLISYYTNRQIGCRSGAAG